MEKLIHFKPSLITKYFFPNDVGWPIQINHGRCFMWALYCHEIFDGTILCSNLCHAFIKHGNRYYDAEFLRGVEDWHELTATHYIPSAITFHSLDGFKQEWDKNPQNYGMSWKEMTDFAQCVLPILREEIGRLRSIAHHN